MGEAKRRKELAKLNPSALPTRSWAIGALTVIANDIFCFRWEGTHADALKLSQQYEATSNDLRLWELRMPVSRYGRSVPESYAVRAAGYLMCFGMPKVGELHRRPSNY